MKKIIDTKTIMKIPKEHQLGSIRVGEELFEKLNGLSKETGLSKHVIARCILESCVDDVSFKQ